MAVLILKCFKNPLLFNIHPDLPILTANLLLKVFESVTLESLFHFIRVVTDSEGGRVTLPKGLNKKFTKDFRLLTPGFFLLSDLKYVFDEDGQAFDIRYPGECLINRVFLKVDFNGNNRDLEQKISLDDTGLSFFIHKNWNASILLTQRGKSFM